MSQSPFVCLADEGKIIQQFRYGTQIAFKRFRTILNNILFKTALIMHGYKSDIRFPAVCIPTGFAESTLENTVQHKMLISLANRTNRQNKIKNL